MTLFKKPISEELSADLHGLIDDYTEKLNDFIPLSEKIEDREELAEGFLSGAAISLVGAIPIGMWVGSSYLESMANGGMIASVIPAGLGIGYGLISLLNKRDSAEILNNQEIDKPLQSVHNHKYGKEFLQQLGDLNIDDSFDDVKAIVENSIKNPPKFQEDIGRDIRDTLRKRNL